jgi:flagellar M-ring protein FliF
VVPETPIWQNPQIIEYSKDALKFIAGIVGLFLIYRRALKPLITRLMEDPTERALKKAAAQRESAESLGISEPQPSYEQNLGVVKKIAKDNPKLVAGVLSGWANGNG